MEFKILNQPDFDRERDGIVKDLLIKAMREHPQTYCPEGTAYRYNLKVARRSYNEGYKQALRDWSLWKDGVQQIGCMQHDIKVIMSEVDLIDGES